jgi:tetratricopeptide (TPR) repeat protein
MTDSGSENDILGQLADEFLERHRRGERPALTDYVNRYPALAEQIRELFSALAVLEDVRPDRASAAPVPAPAGDTPFPRLGDYRIVREIGRGGMGVVYEAEQEALGRRVALKVLPPQALGNPKYLQRFQREARAAARLHHTHIVPVFGVGEDCGTHYYVMQYIEGRPLDEVLAELRRLRSAADAKNKPADSGTPSGEAPPDAEAASAAAVAQSLCNGQFRANPGPNAAVAIDQDAVTALEGPLTPRTPSPAAPSSGAGGSSSPLSDPERPYARSVAQVGAQVAEALDYAAQQGVLHRDVKPSNVLLDVWGNVWLTDFGLARATGTPDLTGTGDLLGTLRYLAPERLHGRGDVRSDVYALGLTLYELLALRPAFDAPVQAQLVQQVTAAAPPRVDHLNPQLPRDLVTVVHKAIARDPGDRYQTAGALAEDLRRFCEDRPIAARRLGLLEKGWRLCRRNRTVTALVVLVVVLLGVAAGSWKWLEWQYAIQHALEQAQRQGRARQVLASALEQLPELRRQGRRAEATAVLQRARSQLDDADSQELQQQLQQAEADTKLANRLEDLWLKMLTLHATGQQAKETLTREYEAAFRSAGLVPVGGNKAGVAVVWHAANGRLAKISVEVAGNEEAVAKRIQQSALRDQLVAALDQWAMWLDDGEMRDRVIAVAWLADRDPKWRLRFRDPAVRKDREALQRVANKLEAADLSPQAVLTLSGWLHAEGGDTEPLLRAGQRRYPSDPWINFNLARLLWDKGKTAEAAGFFRAVLVARPEIGEVHNQLGLALVKEGQFPEAVAAFRRAVELDSKSAVALVNLAHTFQRHGRLEEALAECRRALEREPERATAWMMLGTIFQDQGRFVEAAAVYTHTSRLDPRLALAPYNLGVVHARQDQLQEAADDFRAALKLDPKMAQTHFALSIVLRRQDRRDEAIAELRQGLTLDSTNVAAWAELGADLAEQGQWQEALTACRRALALDPRRSGTQYTLGNTYRALGRLDDAIVAYRQAIELNPKMFQAHNNLGLVFQSQGRLVEAEAAFRRALKLNPKLIQAWTNLAELLQQQKRLSEAENAFRRLIKLAPRNAEAHTRLAIILHGLGRPEEAIATLRQAIQLNPRSAEAHHNLGNILFLKGQLAEAKAAYRRASELAPQNTEVGAKALKQYKHCEHQLALEAKVPLFLDEKAQPANAVEYREAAVLCQYYGRAYAAARLYAAAFAARPELADNLLSHDRYSAACAAALAAAGQGEDAAKLGAAERANLRQQALTWLTADLKAWAALVKHDPREWEWARLTLRRWQKDSDLAGIRDTTELAKLPQDEQEACRRLWREVDAMLRGNPSNSHSP